MAGESKLCAVPGFVSAPADCCGAPPTCTTAYQRKTSSAMLCGFDEFVASLPPRRYRTRSVGGQTNDCYNDGAGLPPGCNSPFQGNKDVWSGAITVSNADCLNGTSPANALYSTTFYSGTPLNCNANVQNPPQLISGNQFDGRAYLSPQGWAHQVKTRTGTFTDWVMSLGCFEYFGTYRTSEAGVYCQQTQEDTEQLAMERKSGTISNWTACSGPCASWRTKRTTNFDFGYQELQLRISASPAPNPAQSYYATVQVLSRIQGSSDPFLPAFELNHQFQGVAGGNYVSPWLQWPTETGLEYLGGTCSVIRQ